MSEKEIMPLRTNLFVQPYLENPYREQRSSGGLQLTDGEFHNPDSGEIDKLNEDIVCGLVLEVGPECKYVRAGDEVFFNIRAAVPIPFMGKGFLLTHEQNLFCVINENLKERINKAIQL